MITTTTNNNDEDNTNNHNNRPSFDPALARRLAELLPQAHYTTV